MFLSGKNIFAYYWDEETLEAKVYNLNINQLKDNNNFCEMVAKSSKKNYVFFWICCLIAFILFIFIIITHIDSEKYLMSECLFYRPVFSVVTFSSFGGLQT